MLEYLAMFGVFCIILDAYLLVGMVVALLTYWLAWLINHDGLGPRQFWFVIFIPILAAPVLIYEAITHCRLFWKIVCYFKGHDFGSAVYISPAVLTFCRRCGTEIQGRTFDDLEPATDEDLEVMDSLYINASEPFNLGEGEVPTSIVWRHDH